MAFKKYQRVAYLGCVFEFIEMVNHHQALIRNKSTLKQKDLVVSVSKLSVYQESFKGFKNGS